MTEILTLEKEQLIMYAATENLEKDHAGILRLIAVMEQMILNISTNATHMEMVLGLVREFADGFHHTKEEHHLFPLLVKKGFSFQQGPVAIMIQEHEQGRKYMAGMAEGIKDYKNGNRSALAAVYRNMQGYTDLISVHIRKENNVLFRMADRMLTAGEQTQLLGKFKDMEAVGYGEEKIGRFMTEIGGLEAVYGLTD